jgi:hypothetical protein
MGKIEIFNPVHPVHPCLLFFPESLTRSLTLAVLNRSRPQL